MWGIGRTAYYIVKYFTQSLGKNFHNYPIGPFLRPPSPQHRKIAFPFKFCTDAGGIVAVSGMETRPTQRPLRA